MRKIVSLLLVLSLTALGRGPYVAPPPFNPHLTSVAPFLGIDARVGISQSAGVITSVADQSGNGYTLTPTNSPTWGATAFNGYPGITLNGSNQNLVRTATIGGTRTQFSYWSVFNRANGTAYHSPLYLPSSVDWGGATGDLYAADAETNPTTAFMWYRSGTGPKAQSAANTFPLSTVVEAVGTYNNATAVLYKNGTSVGSTASASSQWGNKVMMGGLGNGQTGGLTGYNWNASFPTMWLYNGVLSAADITKLHTYAQHNYFDLWQPNQASIRFNGSTYWTGGTGVMNFEYTQPFSISVWMRPDAAQVDKISIMGREQATVNHAGFDSLREFNGRPSLYMAHDQTHYVYSIGNGNIPADGVTWTCVVITSDGSGLDSGIKFYTPALNTNITPLRNDLAGTIQDASIPFNVGNAWGTTPNLGNMNNLAFWTKVLNATEVNQICSQGFAKNLSSLGISGLANWWGMANGSDSLTTIVDRVGSVPLTLGAGTAWIQPNVPMPLQ